MLKYLSRISFANLRVRLLLLVLLAIIPALGLMLYTHLGLRRMVVEDVRDGALRLARLASNDQKDTIRDTRQLLFAMAQLAEVRGGNPDSCSAFFAQLLQQYPQYLTLGVISPDGHIFCSAYPPSGPPNVADQPYFQQVLETRDFAVSNYQIDAISKKAFLNFGYPVLDESNQIQSVVFASLDLSWLNQLAAEAQLPPGSTFTVIDRNGTILVRYPNPEVWVGQSVAEAPIVETILGQQSEGTTEAVGVDGVSKLFAYTPLFGGVGNGDVYVTVGIPSNVAFAQANRLLAQNLLGLSLVTLLAIFAAWFGGYWFILRWINELVNAARRLSTGNLSARTGLPHGQDELSRLARAFDHMAESLEQRVAERNQALIALRETQRTLSTLLSNLPGMAYRSQNNRERTMVFVSQGCCELTGYTPAQLVDNNTVAYGNLIHPDDKERVWNKIQTALRETTPFRLTYRLVTAQNEEKWVWEQGRGVFSTEGKLQALEGFITDTTERVLAYQNLESRVADRTRALLALYDVTAVASESLDLETILTRSLERLLAVMEFEIAVIHLLDESREELFLAAQRGAAVDEMIQKEIFPPDNLLVNWVFKQGQPVVLPNQATQTQFLAEVPAKLARPYVGVPMRAKGRVLGVLSVFGKNGAQFKPDEVALLDSIADQIGVAVENGILYQQAEQLAVMEERSRLARELHDSVTQSLYSLTLFAEVGRRAAGAGNLEQVLDYLGRLGEVAQQTLKEMRLLVYELRTAALETEGLVGALQQRLDAVEKRAGVEARLLVESITELPAIVEEGLYRIAQEALNNALKHATAGAVTVTINVDDQHAILTVADDGRGFDPAKINNQGGMGLTSMRERAERLGGSFFIQSQPGQGATIRVTLPTRRSWSRPVLPVETAEVSP